MSTQSVIDTLQTAINTVSQSAGALGLDMSTPMLQAQGYAIGLTLLTGTQWAAAYDAKSSKYLVRANNIPAVRAWIKTQLAAKTAVDVDWVPVAMPTILQTALPVIGLAALGGFIIAKVLK